jgi:hypothetical protein
MVMDGGRPRVAIRNGMATISLTTGRPEVWSTTEEQKRLKLSFPPVAAAAGTRVDVQLALAHSRVDFARPVPTYQSGDSDLRWAFGEGARGSAVSVQSVPGIHRDSGPSASSTVKNILRFVLDWGSFLLLFALAGWSLGPVAAEVRRRAAEAKARGAKSPTLQPLRARRLAYVGVALVATLLLTWTASDLGFLWATESGFDREKEEIARLVQAVVPTLAIGLFCVTGARAAEQRLGTVALGGTLVSAGLLVTATIAGSRVRFDSDSRDLLRWGLAAGCLIAIGIVAALIAHGLTLWARATCPDLVSRLGLGKKPKRNARLLARGSVALVAALWLLDAYRSWHHFPNGPPFNADLVARAVFAPAELLSLALIALGAVLAAAVGNAVWSWHQNSDGVRLEMPGWRRIVAVLFGGFVVGLGGEIDGYSAPFPFLFSLALSGLGLWLITKHPRLDDASARLGREELLRRSAKLESLAAKQQKLYEDHSKGNVGDEEYYEDQAKLQEQLRSSTRDPQHGDIRHLALGLGPAAVWWKNGLTAMKYGAYAAVVPMLYALYLVLTNDVSSDVHSFNTLGFFALLVVLLKQLIFWLMSAALLGILYPYLPGRTGMLKATVLWLGFVIPNALAALLIDQSAGPGWPFTAAELGLFLFVVGLALDLGSLASGRIYWHHIQDFYRVRSLKALAGYAAPIALLLATVFQQLASGDAQSALGEVVKSVPSLLGAKGG